MLVLVPAVASAEPLSLVTGPGYEPFADPDLPHGGVATRVVRAAFAAAGREVTVSYMPWKRGYRATLAGEFAATYPYVHTPERARKLRYSQPIVETKAKAWVLEGHSLAVSEPRQLDGTTACLPDGYAPSSATAAAYADGAIERLSPGSMRACFRLLRRGRVDFVETNRPVMIASASAVFRDLDGIRPLPFVLEKNALHLVAPRSAAAAQDVIDTFNRGLEKLKASGRYDGMLDTYLAE
ncbi:amino acid ABC transporter substrate-binding protein, PAAT family [Limimonas halophila]|uniref:Amino acid ABC transporter substrate-binding protein, PAAT family n=1 Tax=Limimonas halophila TaxID=1082479 RepID=A0A1G7TP12_9PROT|nr:transporter substrate-binding domain-containing protein [Limimonas halophila]SDG37066.1 amino acid ABC transporter substrate-binding protein, PAAT family [Limimonas halophila]